MINIPTLLSNLTCPNTNFTQSITDMHIHLHTKIIKQKLKKHNLLRNKHTSEKFRCLPFSFIQYNECMTRTNNRYFFLPKSQLNSTQLKKSINR